MPPANQGSKAALVTWTVVATVFGITMAVLALIAYAGRSDAEQRLSGLERQYSDVISTADLTGARVSDLKTAATTEGRTGNLFGYQAYREDQLANLAAGVSGYVPARTAIETRLSQLRARPDDGIEAANLAAAVDQLVGRLDALRQENASLQQANTDLTTAMQQQAQSAEQQMAVLRQSAEQAQQALQETEASKQALSESVQATIDQANQQISELAAGAASNDQASADRIAELQQARDRLQNDFRRLTEKVQRATGGQMLITPDGQVIRSPAEGLLYINLGRNHSITNGMTFEVYDAVRGIPKLESAEDLPRGKASIQIVRVQPNQSEARVVTLAPGQAIREGDLVANLAYDRNIPVRFRVYGAFDLENAGQVNTRDRDRIEALIREFGGQVVPSVTVETDILVIGQEPEVPKPGSATPTAEEIRIIAQAQQQLNEYRAVLKQAQDLNIPILNQNQFLYYIGYFDQARR